MTESTIERWAEGLLVVALVSEEGAEHDLWVLLRHLFVGMKMYDNLSAEEQKKVKSVLRLTKHMFSSTLSVRETKKKKKEKERNTPIPLKKEKEEKKEDKERIQKKEGEISAAGLDGRRAAFREQCLSFRGQYDDELLADFYNYWSETPRRRGTMRFERQRYWNVEKRLARWAKNHMASDNAAAAIRLKDAKKRQTKETQGVAQQQVVAQERIAADARREAEHEQARAAAVTYEEWKRMRSEK